MRAATITFLIAAVLAAGAPAALAQTGDAVGQAAGELPTTLFEPAPDQVPGRAAADDGGGAPLVLAGLLLAAALAAGYVSARPYSSRSTRRS
jgi:hypothetical protein